MRLSFSVHGGEIVSALEVGTLARKEVIPHRAERVKQLSLEVVEVLRRGNRAHTLSDSNLRDLCAVGEELFTLLVPPEIAGQLRKRDPSLYLQVDEELVPVPWELLHDGEGFWCQQFALGRAVTTPQEIVGAVAPIPTVGPLRLLLICCDPRGDLPSVIAEGEKIVSQLDASGSIDAHLLVDPSSAVVRRALKEHDLVHFAGHADHDPAAPEQSGWHLRDGKLSAADVRALGSGRSMPLLVFSNACRSSQTDAWRAAENPTQVYGLANAFLLGGVRLYLGTQWEVVDGQSATFSTAFYDALCRGASAGAAVRMARDEVVRCSGETALAWASYVLYGDPETYLVRRAGAAEEQPRIPSASALQVRHAVPWKRPRRSNELPLLSAITMRRQRRWWWLPTLGLAVVAAGLAAALLIPGEQQLPAIQDAGIQRRDQRSTTAASPLEPGPPVRVRPRVALLLGPGDRSASVCLHRAIAATKRFRLIDEEDVEHLAIAQGISWKKGLEPKRAAALGQSLGADITVAHAPGASVPGEARELVAVDVLTHDVLGRRSAATIGKALCDALAAELLRIVHSEGHVIALRGKRVIIDLGWRSRVAPGVQLEILHKDRPSGTLTVVEVQLDRCTAEGTARVGDRVRLPDR